ncbi:alcohol dehydrogenase catalytic domain-containing protein [Sinomonas susongensis]|uniref:alcohol dehydrogenase catalytic domain-containing protein n=1 Tax=Sinomonas susongensis TaxID=1324851 RepID=UPI0011097241|nr:alcohol dehydrogenase catalytic domain-containing protein [Sinomonas susongensis]
MTSLAGRTEPSAALPAMMRAVVCRGPEDYRLEEVPVPTPDQDELLIKVEAVGVCASDVKCYHGAAKFWGDENRPAWAQKGIIPGHEFVGTVVAAGQRALSQRALELGTRIVCEQIVPCEECRYCQRGQYWMCAPHEMFGFRGFNGAMAEYLVVPSRARVHRAPSGIPAQHAAFAEPLSCALHAVERAEIKFEDVVVVAGCGPIGLGMLAGARSKNPAMVVALDTVDEKLELAKKCGADLTINVGKEDAVQIVKDLTEGYGADVYLEATGHPSAVSQGLNILRKLGTYVEYSVFRSEATVDWSIIGDDKELNVLGAHLGPHCWPAALRLLESGALPMEEICSHQFFLEGFLDAINLVANPAGGSVKVSILP